ncbi:MAG TPA: malto-oligosyltrehalose synthase, partial [Polyangia bacterium]|nr:malto-oligosyltrehalose synthase [Polyangia bacterium]
MNRPATRERGAPLATYRLQLSAAFTLADARRLVPYLDLLGISHAYVSPLLASRSGSSHGYDVVDHGVIERALGTEEDLVALGRALAERGMGLIVDIGPNHMCIADVANGRWRDVLENGQGSVWTEFFDIEWGPPKPALAGKVLLPILGDQFGRELESGALSVEFVDGLFRLRRGGDWLPLAPPSWRLLLEPLWRRVSARAGGESDAAVELESILRALAHWPIERHQARARRHEREAVARRLAQLVAGDPAVAADLAEVVRGFNGVPGAPRSFDALETLVEAQPYRLAHWRVAAHEINYRRFFDINDLAAIRVEREDVFRAVHELPARWTERGIVSGFRVDHVDGLLEPALYLARLRALAERGTAGPPTLLVEKILADDESLPDDWPVDGTTGYEHLAATSGVLIDADASARVRGAWRALTGETRSWADVAYESRRLILETALAAELNVLARRLDALSDQHRYTRDFTFASLHEALREVLSCFPVYRTYVTREAAEVAPRDREVIVRAVRAAVRRNAVVNHSLFQFIEDLLLLRDPAGLQPEQREARRDFVLRVQQLTGPVSAKGIEDTAFYRYFPLPSLAEVGGDPDRLGLTVAEFHAFMQRRARQWPRALSMTATHDTKRGADTRARLHVLSEIPEEWRDAVLSWRALNEALRPDPGCPDPLTEVFIYGALVGGWPAGGPAADRDFGPRLEAFVAKGISEAKRQTSWINPDVAYEDAVAAFTRALLDERRSARFLDSVASFVSRIETAGVLNSLAQVLLAVATPGVPDVYWGGELWDFSFADPDNRRPVDFARRAATLAEVRRGAELDAPATAAELLARPQSGAIKAFVLHRALATRAARREAFEGPSYVPCAVRGRLHGHVVAFARGEPGQRVVAVTGRLFARLADGGRAPVGAAWRDTSVVLPA